MTVRLIEAGARIAQEVIQAVDASDADPDALFLRASLLQFLKIHAEDITTVGGEEALVAAYRTWLQTATGIYLSGDASLVEKFIRDGSNLAAELELAQARAEGYLPQPQRT
jgi:hypothetical protein